MLNDAIGAGWAQKRRFETTGPLCVSTSWYAGRRVEGLHCTRLTAIFGI
jgi:hypothetical protein